MSFFELKIFFLKKKKSGGKKLNCFTNLKQYKRKKRRRNKWFVIGTISSIQADDKQCFFKLYCTRRKERQFFDLVCYASYFVRVRVLDTRVLSFLGYINCGNLLCFFHPWKSECARKIFIESKFLLEFTFDMR